MKRVEVITAKEFKREHHKRRELSVDEELFGPSKAQALYDQMVVNYQNMAPPNRKAVISTIKHRGTGFFGEKALLKLNPNYTITVWEKKVPEQIEVERERVEAPPRDDIKLNTEYVGAYWRFYVPRNTKQPNYTLCVPCYFMEGKLTKIHQTLGFIHLKNDQRWEWTCKAKKDFTFASFNNGKTTQGVTATLQEAIAKVIEAVPEQFRQNIPTDFTKAAGYAEYAERRTLD